MKVTKSFGNFKLILDDAGSGNERMMLKMSNPAEEYVIKGFEINNNDNVIDIGAHVGRLSIYAAVHGKQVYSFEPDPRNVEKLKANVEVNKLKNIHIFDKVVSGTGETIEFTLSQNSSENTILKSDSALPSVNVRGVTLKNIFDLNNIDTCGFLKLDCEGAEYEILLGLPKEYYKKIDKIVLEYHDHLHKDNSLKDLIFVLTKNNFRVSKIQRGAWYTGLLFVKKSKVKPFIYNYFKVYIFDMAFFIVSLAKKRLS